MIHHLSVAAADPQGVGQFFADIMGGVVVDFPPNPGSCMVFKADGRGTAIEVYPAGSVMVPNGEPGAIFLRQPEAFGRSPTHFALSIDLPRDEVLARAKAKGIFGTKMRSVIKLPGAGLDAVVAQQFEVANQILAAGLVSDFCYDNAADTTLKDFLESFSEPPIIGSIGSVFPNDPPPDYSGVVGQALAQVIGQKCDEIEPPG